VPAYARRVPVDEIATEDYNCNIRRYVDNAPPPEPQDVYAHLHGGVPSGEIDALAHFWDNYLSLRESCFVPRASDAKYHDFSKVIADKRAIATHVSAFSGVIERQQIFMQQVESWWQENYTLLKRWRPILKTTAN